jgi:ribonuclease R
MQTKLGEEMTGVVSAVADFGLFVQLEKCLSTGCARSALGSDYFRHERERHRLVGSRGGVVFRLGDSLRVRVARVDLEQRTHRLRAGNVTVASARASATMSAVS